MRCWPHGAADIWRRRGFGPHTRAESAGAAEGGVSTAESGDGKLGAREALAGQRLLKKNRIGDTGKEVARCQVEMERVRWEWGR